MTCAMKMHLCFVYRRHYVTTVDMRHVKNTHNFVVNGQKHEVRVLVFFVRMSGTL